MSDEITPEKITIIIPTLARTARANELRRAVASITGQAGVACKASIIVNGDVYDPALLAELRAMPGVEIHHAPSRGVSAARHYGRKLVDTDYFGFIDDDDEFLPGAMALRLQYLSARPEIDVLVTNGYHVDGERRGLAIEQFDHYLGDPARALLLENWMHNCAGLFRTVTVPAEIFAGLPDHLELTCLALRLSRACRILRVNVPTYIIHEGAADQVSHSMTYIREVPRVLTLILQEAQRPDIRALLRERLRDTLHGAADAELAMGNRWAACRYHLRSLLHPGGWRYLPFTRHLVRA